jgi:hypothetical protein
VSVYKDRTGQRIGQWTVTSDIGRTKRGAVLWQLCHEDGREKYLTTARVIAFDKRHSQEGERR